MLQSSPFSLSPSLSLPPPLFFISFLYMHLCSQTLTGAVLAITATCVSLQCLMRAMSYSDDLKGWTLTLYCPPNVEMVGGTLHHPLRQLLLTLTPAPPSPLPLLPPRLLIATPSLLPTLQWVGLPWTRLLSLEILMVSDILTSTSILRS